jgi:hypothetical protein
MSEASREILTRQLATLLGFDDGADGVLEHLLTIESGEVSAEIAFFVYKPAPCTPVSLSLTQSLTTYCHLFP